MANFNSARWYTGTFDGTNFIPTNEVEIATTATDNQPLNTTFDVGDVITVSFLPGYMFAYQGHTSDGWLGVTTAGSPVSGLEVLFTNGTYTITQSVLISSGAFTTCFLAGTMIATPDGECPVETLEIGDIILAADGSTRDVRWIGRQSVVSIFANPVRSYPIRITAGALGDALPKRDLFLSPDHALLVDDVLIQAGALVNHTSITRVMQPNERFTYFHIETEDHALILAEGAPAETFIDNVSRQRFDNYAEFEALYGAAPEPMQELPQPRAASARQVPRAIRERIAAAAAVLVPALDEVG